METGMAVSLSFRGPVRYRLGGAAALGQAVVETFAVQRAICGALFPVVPNFGNKNKNAALS